MADDERQANRLRALAQTAILFTDATLDFHRLLDVIARQCAELIGDGCYLRLVGDDGVSLIPVATYHPDPDTQRYLRETTDALPLKVGEGISGKVVATGEPAFMPVVPFEDYRARTKPEFAAVFERIGISSLMVVPLRARGTKLGFLALVRNGIGRAPYTDDDLDLVKDLAERAGLAIDNSQMVGSLERLVEERTRALEQTNQELESFAFTVSRDLRSPLRAIEGLSHALDEDHGSSLDSEGQRLIAVIRKNTRRMTQLVDDLLRLSRTGHHGIGEIVPIDMHALVDGALETARATRPGRALEVRIGELPAAIGNAGLLRQVWINLIDNAIKYSGKRDVVRIEIEGRLDDDRLRYAVTDHGAGFDPSHAGKLFGVFQRLHSDAEFEGTGVGLALVHRIVTRHGGTVTAEGRPGAGATFAFTLPSRGPVT